PARVDDPDAAAVVERTILSGWHHEHLDGVAGRNDCPHVFRISAAPCLYDSRFREPLRDLVDVRNRRVRRPRVAARLVGDDGGTAPSWPGWGRLPHRFRAARRPGTRASGSHRPSRWTSADVE